ncbi:alpha/beta hydrolase [Hymenobacter volaticus]|uniref:Alpha/beta hydrolase n=1 Tax=Hymenobacter volaticus TaxID=2932254 RepID=A0ABY4GED7_9BACT|nr:alpha/beta hydrolase [Hymenobacter volaticus]UOQ69212.1 alpha/beta hydrolase [Hymenobacter volaticus]
MPNNPINTVVFVTGAFVSSTCWDAWKAYFENQGYTCYAPAHPHKEGAAAALRSEHPHSAIAHNSLTSVVASYAAFIRQLPEKPILIGHSFGGLIVQLLLQQDLGAAGVAIHSVPPQGVLTLKWSFFRSVTPALGLFTSLKKTYLMSFQHWQYTFTNGLDGTTQRATYEQLVVPESKKMARGALTKEARVDFARPHAPLLFVAGSTDHIMPASLNYSNYQRYANYNESITDYKEFAGRNHLVLGLPTWRESADFVLDWLGRTAGTPAPARRRTAEPHA